MKDNKIPVSQEIKKHLLTGISWMIPLIVAAGICIALGQVLGGTDVGEKTGTCLLYTSFSDLFAARFFLPFLPPLDRLQQRGVSWLHCVSREHRLASVSYTHLDVYKRQPSSRRLVNRHRPSASAQRILTVSPRRPRKIGRAHV